MTSRPASDRFLRISTICLAFLTILVWVGPWLDWVGGVQATLGRINNLSMLVVAIYVTLLFAVPAGMRSFRERLLLAVTAGLMLFATMISLDRYGDWLITFGGLFALFGAVSAGFGAYILGKSGKGLHVRIVGLMVATLPALTLPVLMIAADREAYDAFWLNVYGYSNVRVFGYFAAVTTVVLSGLALNSLQRRTAMSLVHAAALTLSWSLLFWSGSRAGMLATVFAIALGWIVQFRKALWQILFVTGTAIAGAFLSMLYYTPGKWFGLINRVQDTAERMEAGGVARASTNRLEMWQWVLDRVMDEPLLGHGYLPMARLMTDDFRFYHTHNVVLEYLLSFGLIAGSMMLLLTFGLWVRALIAAHRLGNPVALALSMLAILLPIYAMFSATLFFPFHLMVFFLSVGALIGWDTWERRTDDTEDAPFRPNTDWMFEDLDTVKPSS